MRLPPRPVRRLLGVAILGLLLAAVLTLPLLALVALVASPWLPGPMRGVRLLAFAVVVLLVESTLLLAALALWVASGFGYWVARPKFVRAHHTSLRIGLDVVVHAARWLFQLDIRTDGRSWSPLDDGVPGSENAMVVLSRHAGPGDSLLLLQTLMNRDHLRRPRVVMKDSLQLDPATDVYFNRLRSAFVRPGAGDEAEAQIAKLASNLGEEDALLIFPEGGNFTPRRRLRAIDSLRRGGHDESAERAEAMQHVLPPRPGGVAAALDAAPHADVVFVAHTGLEHIVAFRDVWRAIPQDQTLSMQWWFWRADQVPTGRDERIAWLFDRWGEIDAWIASYPPSESARRT
ncbi:MAG: lysophospholipid acyltransferase family protein [Nocardioidaceae bacterium]|nr:lysophospholipid acyltransferase family protein [Nocardioidaceae bacterium]